jgi:hypothetical protein
MRGLQTALSLQSKGRVSVVLAQDAVLAVLRDSLSYATGILKQLESHTASILVLAMTVTYADVRLRIEDTRKFSYEVAKTLLAVRSKIRSTPGSSCLKTPLCH